MDCSHLYSIFTFSKQVEFTIHASHCLPKNEGFTREWSSRYRTSGLILPLQMVFGPCLQKDQIRGRVACKSGEQRLVCVKCSMTRSRGSWTETSVSLKFTDIYQAILLSHGLVRQPDTPYLSSSAVICSSSVNPASSCINAYAVGTIIAFSFQCWG